MENSAFDKGVEKGELELKSVNIMESNNHISSDNTGGNQSNMCRPEICRNMHKRYLEQESKVASSPWHRLKTTFLLGIIGILVLWAIVYSTCSGLSLV